MTVQEVFDQNGYQFTHWLMEDFRSDGDGWWHHLAEHERRELFISMLTGSSELTRTLFQEVCDNYSEDLTDVLNRWDGDSQA